LPILRILLIVLMTAGSAGAEAVSILNGALSGARGALIAVRQDETITGPSLFAGRAETGMFAHRAVPTLGPPGVPPPRGSLDRLRHLIGQAESRRDGYDAVQHGARVRPGRAPTQMTLREVFAWIDATPGQPHAIGRYQFIPSTLRRLVGIVGIRESARFTPEVQDKLADVLLAEAGLGEVTAGRMGRHTFMNNLAKIWAGLPNSTGRSHYHGYAGNRASITWADFDAEMAAIFPG